MQRSAAFLLLAILARVALAQDPLGPFYLHDPAARTLEGDLMDNPLFHDAGVASANEKLWVAWLEYVPGQGEHLWIGQREEDGWAAQRCLTEAPGTFSTPTLTVAADDSQTVWLSYEAEVDGQWDLLLWKFEPDRFITNPIPIAADPGVDIHHRAAPDGGGGMWFVWQAGREGQFEILARYWDGDRFGKTHQVSRSPRGDWHPDLTILPDGHVCVVWDHYNGNDYDVVTRTLAPEGWHSTFSVAATPAFEGRASIASNSEGEVFVAWEEGAENWGHRYVSAYYPQKVFASLTEPNGPLHRFRKIRVARLNHPLPTRSQVEPSLPMPALEEALKRVEGSGEVLPIGAYYERPRLRFDAQGRLWTFYRHFYAHLLGIGPDHHYEEGIGVYARCLTQQGWSPPVRLAPDQGDGIQRLEVVAQGTGVAAAWTVGRTDRRPLDRPQGMVLATLPDPEAGETLSALPGKSRFMVGARIPNDLPPTPPVAEFEGKPYHLFRGDLHRHTDLSLCMVPVDGSIDDAYRFAIDVAQLDFLGITDHSRDIDLADPLSLLWRRSRNEVTRHRLGETFIPYFAYERSRQDTDHNVISLRDDMLRSFEPPLPTFWEICDSDTLTIPHQPFFNRGLWEYNSDRFRPLLEIYQGCRDSTAEADAHIGLRKGYQFGFIASSDHLSTGASFACVWAETPDRESIFRALQARRTFGSTDRINLSVHAGGHWMGESFSAESMPPLRIKAEGTNRIRLVQVVVDGERKLTLLPGTREIDLEQNLDLPKGKHFVYVRLEQEDGNHAWASPFFVEIGG